MYETYGALNVSQLISFILISAVSLNWVHLNSSFKINSLLKNKNKFKSLIQIILLLVIGFMLIYLCSYRTIGIHSGGTDANSYKLYYEGNLKKAHFEPGFRIIVNIISKFSANYSAFLIVTSIIMLYCLYKFFQDVKPSKYNLLLFVTMLALYFDSFNVLRTVLAIFISLNVYKNIYENKYGRAFLLAILCTSIHMSAIILIPIIFVNMIFKNKDRIKVASLILLIILLCIVTFLSYIILERYLTYTEYKSYADSGQLVVFVYIFLAIVFFLCVKNYNKLVEYNPINRIFITSIPVCFIVFIGQLNMVIMYRMVEFFLPIAYTLLVQLLHIKKSIIIKIFILTMLMYKIITFFLHARSLGIIF